MKTEKLLWILVFTLVMTHLTSSLIYSGELWKLQPVIKTGEPLPDSPEEKISGFGPCYVIDQERMVVWVKTSYSTVEKWSLLMLSKDKREVLAREGKKVMITTSSGSFGPFWIKHDIKFKGEFSILQCEKVLLFLGQLGKNPFLWDGSGFRYLVPPGGTVQFNGREKTIKSSEIFDPYLSLTGKSHQVPDSLALILNLSEPKKAKGIAWSDGEKVVPLLFEADPLTNDSELIVMDIAYQKPWDVGLGLAVAVDGAMIRAEVQDKRMIRRWGYFYATGNGAEPVFWNGIPVPGIPGETVKRAAIQWTNAPGTYIAQFIRSTNKLVESTLVRGDQFFPLTDFNPKIATNYNIAMIHKISDDPLKIVFRRSMKKISASKIEYRTDFCLFDGQKLIELTSPGQVMDDQSYCYGTGGEFPGVIIVGNAKPEFSKSFEVGRWYLDSRDTGRGLQPIPLMPIEGGRSVSLEAVVKWLPGGDAVVALPDGVFLIRKSGTERP